MIEGLILDKFLQVGNFIYMENYLKIEINSSYVDIINKTTKELKLVLAEKDDKVYKLKEDLGLGYIKLEEVWFGVDRCTSNKAKFITRNLS